MSNKVFEEVIEKKIKTIPASPTISSPTISGHVTIEAVDGLKEDIKDLRESWKREEE